MADEHLEALWAHVLANWRSEAAHAAFLDHCRATGRLAEAAARYRAEVGEPSPASRWDRDRPQVPGAEAAAEGSRASYRDHAAHPHADIARKQLNAILAIALAEMQASRSARGGTDERSRRVLRGAAVGVVAMIVLAAFHLLARG